MSDEITENDVHRIKCMFWDRIDQRELIDAITYLNLKNLELEMKIKDKDHLISDLNNHLEKFMDKK